MAKLNERTVHNVSFSLSIVWSNKYDRERMNISHLVSSCTYDFGVFAQWRRTLFVFSILFEIEKYESYWLHSAQRKKMYRRMWEMWRKSRRRDCQSECWKCVDFRCDLVKTTHEFISIFEIFINHLQIHWPNLTHSNTEQLKHQAFAIKDTEFGWQFHRVIWSY